MAGPILRAQVYSDGGGRLLWLHQEVGRGIAIQAIAKRREMELLKASMKREHGT